MRHVLLLLLLLGLSAACLCTGAAPITFSQVWHALTGGADEVNTFIILQLRLPALLTALAAGASLSLSGHALQTLLRNPLADPSLLGVGAGSTLGAALILMASQWISALHTSLLSLSAAAFLGAILVILLLATIAARTQGVATVLIAGLMLSFLIGAAVTLLSFHASATGLQHFVVWGMGSFSATSLSESLGLLLFTLFCALALWTMAGKMDALLLGDAYAASVGISVRAVRTGVLILVGLLTASATAACGPVAFIGLAAPHIARLLTPHRTHAALLPTTALTGMLICVTALLLCTLPGGGHTLPLAALTPLIGAPVCLYLLLYARKQG